MALNANPAQIPLAATGEEPTAQVGVDYGSGHGDYVTVSGQATFGTPPGTEWEYRVVVFNADNLTDVVYDRTVRCAAHAATCAVPTETVMVNSHFQEYTVTGVVYDVPSGAVISDAVPRSVSTSFC